MQLNISESGIFGAVRSSALPPWELALPIPATVLPSIYFITWDSRHSKRPSKVISRYWSKNFHLNCDYFGTVLRCLAAQVLWLLKRLLPWAFSNFLSNLSNLSNFASKHLKCQQLWKMQTFLIYCCVNSLVGEQKVFGKRNKENPFYWPGVGFRHILNFGVPFLTSKIPILIFFVHGLVQPPVLNGSFGCMYNKAVGMLFFGFPGQDHPQMQISNNHKAQTNNITWKFVLKCWTRCYTVRL